MIRLVAALTAFLLVACGEGETVSAPSPPPPVTEEPASEPREEPTVEPSEEPTVEPTEEPALPTGACDAAFAEAAAVDQMQDTVADLYPAAHACTSVEDWVAASEGNPGAIDVDPEVFLGNMCLSPEIADADLCAEVTD